VIKGGGLRSGAGDFVRDRALEAGGVVGGDGEVVSDAALGQRS
jgi:hypothetical protein